jgi:hypothetical protein
VDSALKNKVQMIEGKLGFLKDLLSQLDEMLIKPNGEALSFAPRI